VAGAFDISTAYAGDLEPFEVGFATRTPRHPPA